MKALPLQILPKSSVPLFQEVISERTKWMGFLPPHLDNSRVYISLLLLNDQLPFVSYPAMFSKLRVVIVLSLGLHTRSPQ